MKDSYNVATAIHIALTDTINTCQISPSLYEKELALRNYGNNPSAHKDAVIEALKQYRDIFDNAIKYLENAGETE